MCTCYKVIASEKDESTYRYHDIHGKILCTNVVLEFLPCFSEEWADSQSVVISQLPPVYIPFLYYTNLLAKLGRPAKLWGKKANILMKYCVMLPVGNISKKIEALRLTWVLWQWQREEVLVKKNLNYKYRYKFVVNYVCWTSGRLRTQTVNNQVKNCKIHHIHFRQWIRYSYKDCNGTSTGKCQCVLVWTTHTVGALTIDAQSPKTKRNVFPHLLSTIQ